VTRRVNSVFISKFRHKNTVGSTRGPVICFSKLHDCTHGSNISDNYAHVYDMGVGARDLVANFDVGPELSTLTRSHPIRDEDGQFHVAKRLDSKLHLKISQTRRVNVVMQCMLSEKMEATTY